VDVLDSFLGDDDMIVSRGPVMVLDKVHVGIRWFLLTSRAYVGMGMETADNILAIMFAIHTGDRLDTCSFAFRPSFHAQLTGLRIFEDEPSLFGRVLASDVAILRRLFQSRFYARIVQQSLPRFGRAGCDRRRRLVRRALKRLGNRPLRGFHDSLQGGKHFVIPPQANRRQSPRLRDHNYPGPLASSAPKSAPRVHRVWRPAEFPCRSTLFAKSDARRNLERRQTSERQT